MERDAQGRAEGGRDRRELAHLLLELLERPRADILRDHRVDPDHLDVEGLHELRQVLRRGPVRIIEDDLELRVGDLALVRDLAEEGVAVLLAHSRDLDDPADVVVRASAEVLAEERVLDLALLGLVHVQRLPVEELDVTHPHVERGDADVDAAGRAHAARLKAADRERRLGEVRDVHAGADDPGHERTLQDPAGTVLVAVHRDRGAARQRRRVRRAEARGELRREVDVHEPGHAEPSEERPAALGSPDEARPDVRAVLDLLVRPDLHGRAHARALVDDRVVADDRAFLEDHARFERALPADDGAAQIGAFADVAVAPHDRALDARELIDRHRVAKDRRSDDLDATADPYAHSDVTRVGNASARLYLYHS